jgi:hypothetical protein
MTPERKRLFETLVALGDKAEKLGEDTVAGMLYLASTAVLSEREEKMLGKTFRKYAETRAKRLDTDIEKEKKSPPCGYKFNKRQDRHETGSADYGTDYTPPDPAHPR